jgi:putative membrane protein
VGSTLAPMSTAAAVLVGLVAVEHFYFLVMEMFLWTTPRVRRAFNLTADFAAASRTLAANQGLYNGFLAAGLVWSLVADAAPAFSLRLFFLGCVVVAGVFGAATASRRILWIQAFPAAVALALTFAAR